MNTPREPSLLHLRDNMATSDSSIFTSSDFRIYVRDDSQSATKRYRLVAYHEDREEPCTLYFEIIADMSSSFDPADVYDTLASKLVRKFPSLIKKDVVDILDKLNIIDTAKFYTSINDSRLQRIKYY